MSRYQEERVPIPTPWRLRRELHLRRPPWWMLLLLAIVVVATWIPLYLIFSARGTTSPHPRVHVFMDMDKQPRFGPQASHPWFEDGRAMRGPIEGTLARNHLHHNVHFFDGYTLDAASGAVEFFETLPPEITVDDKLLERGRQRYQIYCAICHGDSGTGQGPINLRAIELKEPKWIPPTNLMTEEIRARADGQIYQAIRDGVRNMPSYKSQIAPRDCWAIVAYLRQLQANSPVAPAPSEPTEPIEP